MTTGENLMPEILLIGVEEIIKNILASFQEKIRVRELPSCIEKLVDIKLPEKPLAIVCGPADSGVPIVELAQFLRMEYQDSHIFYATTCKEGFENKSFIKNGFTDAFLLPWEVETFTEIFKTCIAAFSPRAEKTYRPVKVVDLSADAVLDFDTFVHLPQNNKFLVFAPAGEEIGEGKITRLNNHQMSSLQVKVSDLPKFYEYTAKRLKDLGKPNGVSETERQQRMRQAVRGLIGSIFNTEVKDGTIDSGKKALEDCSEIVKSYLVQSDTGWYAKLNTLVGSLTTSYDHCSNVATFAAMFSMALAIGKPEDLATAGILHDIGVAELPQEIQLKKVSDYTADEFEIYKKHTEYSLQLIKQRKLIVPKEVLMACEQHHERFNGTGYPKGVAGSRICVEARLLAIADRFDELTQVEEEKKRLTPSSALEQMCVENTNQESLAVYDPEILKKLKQLFQS